MNLLKEDNLDEESEMAIMGIGESASVEGF
jgi:hypothetical protein